VTDEADVQQIYVHSVAIVVNGFCSNWLVH